MDIEKEVGQRVAEILKIPPQKFAPDQRLVEIRGWDSLRFMRLLMSLEKDWELRFQASEVAPLKTWSEFMALIRAKKSSERGGGQVK